MANILHLTALSKTHQSIVNYNPTIKILSMYLYTYYPLHLYTMMTSLTFMSCYSEFFPEFPRHKDKFIFLPSVNSISFVDILPRIRLANICSFSFSPSPPSPPLNVRLTHISKVRNLVQPSDPIPP